MDSRSKTKSAVDSREVDKAIVAFTWVLEKKMSHGAAQNTNVDTLDPYSPVVGITVIRKLLKDDMQMMESFITLTSFTSSTEAKAKKSGKLRRISSKRDLQKTTLLTISASSGRTT